MLRVECERDDDIDADVPGPLDDVVCKCGEKSGRLVSGALFTLDWLKWLAE